MLGTSYPCLHKLVQKVYASTSAECTLVPILYKHLNCYIACIFVKAFFSVSIELLERSLFTLVVIKIQMVGDKKGTKMPSLL